MKFSIIMPTYNNADVIKKSVESIFVQTYENWELIIVNDGSTDDTVEVLEEYIKNDNRVKLITQVNKGPFQARINGLKQATGDYLLFLDADDYYEKDSLLILNEFITKVNDVDVIIFNYNRVDSLNNKSQIKKYPNITNDIEKIPNEIIINELLSSNKHNSLCNKVFRREFYEKERVSYDEDLFLLMSEDKLLNLPILCNSKNTYYLNKPLYNYVFNPESLTQTFNLLKFEHGLKVHSLIEKYLKDNNFSDKHLRLFYTNYIKDILRKYLAYIKNNSPSRVEKKKTLSIVNSMVTYKNAKNYINKFKRSYKHISKEKVLKLEIDIFFLRVLNKLGIVKF